MAEWALMAAATIVTCITFDMWARLMEASRNKALAPEEIAMPRGPATWFRHLVIMS